MADRLNITIIAQTFHERNYLVLLHGNDVTQEEIDEVLLQNLPNHSSVKVMVTEDARMSRSVIIGQEPQLADDVLSFGTCPFERENIYRNKRAGLFNAARLFLDIIE